MYMSARFACSLAKGGIEMLGKVLKIVGYAVVDLLVVAVVEGRKQEPAMEVEIVE